MSRQVKGVPSIFPDNSAGMSAAIRHLHDLGHESLTYVAGPEGSWADDARYKSICKFAEKYKFAVSRIGPFLPTYEDGLAASRQLAAKPPTAILAHNDILAIGVMNGLMSYGVSVPNDVSIVGVDDILSARLVRPKLTTVAIPAVQLGYNAVKILIAIKKRKHFANVPCQILPVQLKQRESTGKARHQKNLW